MSYQEKRTVTSMISGALVLAAYCLYAFGRYRAGTVEAGDLRFWAGRMLLFIGIGIAATILIQIVFHILMAISIAVKDRSRDEKEINRRIEAAVVEDEMDKLIELKSSRAGFIVAGVGFVGALVSLVLGYPPAVMINIVFLSFGLGSLLEGVVSLVYYRKGVRRA